MTPDEAIAIARRRSDTLSRWAGQEVCFDAVLAAEIERLRAALRTLGFGDVADGAEVTDGLAERGA